MYENLQQKRNLEKSNGLDETQNRFETEEISTNNLTNLYPLKYISKKSHASPKVEPMFVPFKILGKSKNNGYPPWDLGKRRQKIYQGICGRQP